MEIGKYIKKLRLRADMTISDVAEKSKVSPPTIRKIEKGGKVDLGKLANVCDVLDKEVRISIIKKRNTN